MGIFDPDLDDFEYEPRSYEYGPLPGLTRQTGLIKRAARWGIAGLAAFGLFDLARSIGQNTEAESLLDHARTVAVADFNGWEQLKDYVAPQEFADPLLTNNEARAPLFDPERSADVGHILVVSSLVAGSAIARMRAREDYY